MIVPVEPVICTYCEREYLGEADWMIGWDEVICPECQASAL